MITDKKRREVSDALRSCDVINSGSGRYCYSFNGSICGCMLVGTSESSVREAITFLADLIEPSGKERDNRVQPTN